MNLLRLLIVSLIFATPLQEQKRSDVLPPDSNDFINIVKYLASEKTQGREVGTKGGYLTADFIALQMSENGLLPAGESKLQMGLPNSFLGDEVLFFLLSKCFDCCFYTRNLLSFNS